MTGRKGTRRWTHTRRLDYSALRNPPIRRAFFVFGLMPYGFISPPRLYANLSSTSEEVNNMYNARPWNGATPPVAYTRTTALTLPSIPPILSVYKTINPACPIPHQPEEENMNLTRRRLLSSAIATLPLGFASRAFAQSATTLKISHQFP